MGGGAEVHLHEILRRAVGWGHEVTWLSARYPGAAAEEVADDGIRYRRRGRWQLANFVLPRLMQDELRRRSHDLVVDDINKIPFFTPWYTRLPVLALVPHLFGATVFRETNPILAAYVATSELAIPWAYRECPFLAISRSTADDLASRGIARRRIEVVECGMDHEPYLREDPPPRADVPTLIHLGRLRRYKSVDVALRALARIRAHLPGAVLEVVGDGPDEGRLRRLAERLGLADAVRFHGYLPRPEVVDLLYRSHLCLNPSPKEGWGLTVIEANECGVPVVASRRPGLVDSVRDGVTGRLARYGDDEDFAAKALELLTDEARWRTCSQDAVRWARSFSWDECARRSVEAMERCVAEGR
jgi:glycosyltransferase involved in cell wall biosynthesis